MNPRVLSSFTVLLTAIPMKPLFSFPRVAPTHLPAEGRERHVLQKETSESPENGSGEGRNECLCPLSLFLLLPPLPTSPLYFEDLSRLLSSLPEVRRERERDLTSVEIGAILSLGSRKGWQYTALASDAVQKRRRKWHDSHHLRKSYGPPQKSH